MTHSELKENVRRGKSDFPLSLYTVDGGCGLVLPCHWHDEFEIYHQESGKAVVRIGNQEYPAKAGDCLFVNKGEIHSAVGSEPAGCRYHSIVFDLSIFNSLVPDSCQQILNNLSLSRALVLHRIPNEDYNRQVERLVEKMIHKLSEKTQGYELYIKGGIYILFALFQESGSLCENKKRQNRANYYDGIIKKVMDYILTHYQNRLYLQELADIAQMSKFAFCRCFSQQTGVTPMQYVNILRTDKAYTLLVSTESSVTDTAAQCGFDNMSYFAKTFRKYRGISPSDVRK